MAAKGPVDGRVLDYITRTRGTRDLTSPRAIEGGEVLERSD
jgi:hypothetical protein